MKMKEITEFKNNYEKDYEIARIRNILEVKNKDKNSLMNYLSFLNKIILENYKLVEKEKNPNNISVQLLIMARNLKYIDDSFYNKKIKLANIKN